MKQKLALIDAHALIHRAYHALPPMSAQDGSPTGAVYGFTSMLLKMLETLKPTHVVAAFDVKGPTFREEKYEDYKAGRDAPPDDLITQFELVRDVLTAFGIPIFDKQGFEADDILGTICEQVDGGVKKVIVTGDMDALQLVDKTTSVFAPKRGISDTILYTEEGVKEKYGFGPEHVVDYKGLRGDPSDNIPGVAGVGDKTATDLIMKYGSVEEIFAHLDEIEGRAKKALDGSEKDALLSKDLATIRRDVPIKFALEDAVMDGWSSEDVRAVFERLGFRSLLNRLPKGGEAIQPTLLAEDPAQEAFEMPENYVLVQSKKEQQALREKLMKTKVIAFDTETDGLGAREYPIVGMSFAMKKGKNITAYYVPTQPDDLGDWKELLESESPKKTGHNLKYDYQVLRQSDITLGGIVFDSMIAAYLVNPSGRQYSLDSLAVTELGHHMIPITDLIGEGKDQKKVSEVPLQVLARYACEDADISLQLFDHFAPQIKEEGLTRVFEELEIPLVPVLAEIELNGVALDKNALQDLQKTTQRRIDDLTKKIQKHAGTEFNVNSSQQLREVLFEKLKLPTENIKRVQSGYSTAATELLKLRGEHPIIELLEEYRELAKLKNTYIDVLPKMADSKTNRIYTQFHQTVAATGRLSSSNPNLQNIPVRTELGQEVRRAFVAEAGSVLVKADYSQLELRIAAHMSKDEKLLDSFRAGEDIHAATAASVFDIPQDSVTADQRRQAKTLNFGVLYGMGPQSFAREAEISIEEARAFIGRYHDRYKGLSQFVSDTLDFAHDNGWVESMYGRKRYVPEIESNNPAIVAQAERVAFNFPIQGTEADILKSAMITLQKEIEEHFMKSKIVLTVHDELVCEVPKGDVKKFGPQMKAIMEGVITLDVPLVVDVEVGANWKDVQPL